MCCASCTDDDEEYEGGYDEPVVMTASGDHHSDEFVDDGFAGDNEPHVGIVHSNGDG